MEIMEDPIRSFISAIAAAIPALYDIVLRLVVVYIYYIYMCVAPFGCCCCVVFAVCWNGVSFWDGRLPLFWWFVPLVDEVRRIRAVYVPTWHSTKLCHFWNSIQRTLSSRARYRRARMDEPGHRTLEPVRYQMGTTEPRQPSTIVAPWSSHLRRTKKWEHHQKKLRGTELKLHIIASLLHTYDCHTQNDKVYHWNHPAIPSR